ncbi:MAG: tail fiber domain-containing protein, partial [Chlorobi bacterium]|nr:tail fiber domain-containing protein [Chlorobiota bacterium]
MKIFVFVLATFFFAIISTQAQDITATLGGDTSTDYFEVENSSGTLLFRLNGTGNLGLGLTNPAYKLSVNGNINLQSGFSYHINGQPILNGIMSSTFVGIGAGINNTNSVNTYNTFVGVNAGFSNTTGMSNTCLGYEAGSGLTDQMENVIIGYNAGQYIDESANYNVIIGAEAGKNLLAGKNCFIGDGSGYSADLAEKNVAVGEASGFSLSDGSNNVLLGESAGYSLTNGYGNTFVGHEAGENTSGSGSYNVFIGYLAGKNISGDNKLVIENSASLQPLIYGDFSTDDVKIYGDLTVTGTITEISDARYKKNIAPIENASEKIQNISGVYYDWDKENHPELVTGSGREIGVLAQDVEKVFPELVKIDEKGFKSVN